MGRLCRKISGLVSGNPGGRPAVKEPRGGRKTPPVSARQEPGSLRSQQRPTRKVGSEWNTGKSCQ
jgi:hypothetical protein